MPSSDAFRRQCKLNFRPKIDFSEWFSVYQWTQFFLSSFKKLIINFFYPSKNYNMIHLSETDLKSGYMSNDST